MDAKMCDFFILILTRFFRFYLFPDQYSDLPKITSSVLKTRATLSMHKVYKYLIKKLSSEKVIEDMPDD